MSDTTRLVIRCIAAGLQGAMAFSLLVIIFACKVQNTVRATTIAVSNSSVQSLRDSVYWDTDVELKYRYWNPYIILFTLQWITASFAFKYVLDWRYELTLFSFLWNAVGVCMLLGWAFMHYSTDQFVQIWGCVFAFVVASVFQSTQYYYAERIVQRVNDYFKKLTPTGNKAYVNGNLVYFYTCAS